MLLRPRPRPKRILGPFGCVGDGWAPSSGHAESDAVKCRRQDVSCWDYRKSNVDSHGMKKDDRLKLETHVEREKGIALAVAVATMLGVGSVEVISVVLAGGPGAVVVLEHGSQKTQPNDEERRNA